MSEAKRSNILSIGHDQSAGEAARHAAAEGGGRSSAYPSIAVTLAAVLVTNLVGLMVVTALGYAFAVDRIEDAAIADALQARAEAVRHELSAAVERSAAALEGVARRVDVAAPSAAAPLLAALRDGDPLLDWTALVNLEGDVVAASDGAGVGSRVVDRAFFAEGLSGPTLVDVSALPARSVRDEAGLPQSPAFATLAVPVRDADGAATGVLAARVGTAEAARRLSGLAGALGIDVAAVAADGRMIAASADGRVRKADAASVRAAQVGAAGVIADAPGVAGATRSVLVHGIAPAGLPKLSWTVVARIPEAAPLTAAAPPIKALAAPAAAALALYVLVAALYVRLYARPLRRLAATAADIAAGRFDVYPFESRRTAEAAALSAALGKIQMRLHAAETALAGSTRPLLAYRPDEAQPGPRGPAAEREAAAA